MSSQNASSSSSNQEEQQPFSDTAMVAREFPRFLELPTELQIRVWECAFWAPRQRRLAVLRVSSTPSPGLSYQVLSLNDRQARVGSISNALYLRETDHVASLLTASHRSRTVILPLVQQTMQTSWLQRLGLARYHIKPDVDIVCFGGDLNLMSVNRFVMAASLVLGTELENIMVPAHDFWRLCQQNLQLGHVDPVRTALATLRNVDPVWSEMFGPDTLPNPGLPRTMYFLLKTPAPRNTRCAHGPACRHFEHLKLFDPSASANWDLAIHEPYNIQSRFQFYENVGLVHNITRFWETVEATPGFAGTIPAIFFVQLTE